MGGCPSAPGNLSTGSKNPGNISSGRRQAAEKFLGIAQQKWDRLPKAVKTKDVARLSLQDPPSVSQIPRCSFSSSSLFTVESQIRFASQGAGVIDGFRLSVLEALESQEHFAPQDPGLLDPRNGDFLESQEHFAPQDPELFRSQERGLFRIPGTFRSQDPGLFRSQERGLFRIPGTFRFPGWDSLDSHDHFVPQDP